MKKFLFYVLILSVLVLAACGETENNSSEEDDVATGESTNEMTELEEENEELRRQLEEQDDEDGNDEVMTEETNDTDEENSSIEDDESDDTERSEEPDNQNHTEGDRSDLVFDINSPEVQSQLIGTKSGNHEGNFEQDAITIGMSQTEVEEMYGKYDFSFYYQGAAPAFYENLAVVYSELEPYGPDDDSGASMNDINPDENIVEAIYYYAGVTPGEMIQALGEPDEEDDGSRSMNGLPYYIYEGEGEDGRYYSTGAGTINTPEGERVGLIRRGIHEEKPNDSNNTANEDSYFGDEAQTEGFPVTLTEEDDNFIYDTLRNFIFSTYLNSLADYYNDVDNEILNLTEGNALQTVQENKESGYFQDYQNGTGDIVSIEQISENEYSVTVNRTFSHASSDGEQSTQVTYTVTDIDGVLKISDF